MPIFIVSFCELVMYLVEIKQQLIKRVSFSKEELRF